jgi:chromosome partitioning protein
MKTVAVFAVKGGVGKTATAVNLAYAAASSGGRRTLLWDLDAQGAASFTLRLQEQPKSDGKSAGRARAAFAGDASLADLIRHSAWANLDVLPADQSLRRLEGDLAASDKAKLLKRMLKSLEGDYDRVILDCPPGLSELAERVFRAADIIVSPLIPTPLSQRALDQLAQRIGKSAGDAPLLLPVWSMVDRRKALHKATVAGHPDRPAIPYAAAVEAMAVRQAPIGVTAPGSAAARAFAGLWATVERRLIA